MCFVFIVFFVLLLLLLFIIYSSSLGGGGRARTSASARLAPSDEARSFSASASCAAALARSRSASSVTCSSCARGKKVFVVTPEKYWDSRLGKARYNSYKKYVGNDKLGEAIRQYGLENPKAPIILKNSENGAMLYLKYGSKN